MRTEVFRQHKYGTTVKGGSLSNDTGFAVGMSGSGFTVLADFDGDSGGETYVELTRSERHLASREFI